MSVILLAFAFGCFALGALLVLVHEAVGSVGPSLLLFLGLSFLTAAALVERRT